MRNVFLAMLAMFMLAAVTSKPARAHIELQTPTARYVQNNNGLKTAPCGSGTATGTVTRLTAGQMLTVTWKESVPHAGHYRIGIAARDSDFVEPTSLSIPASLPVWDLADGIPDKTGTQTYTQTVQVPGTPCTACVLQLLQVMAAGTDGTNNGSFSGVYHACADVTISAGAADAGASSDAVIALDTKTMAPEIPPDTVSTGGTLSRGGAIGSGGYAGGGGAPATGGTSYPTGGATTGGAVTSGGIRTSDVGGSSTAGGSAAGPMTGGDSGAGGEPHSSQSTGGSGDSTGGRGGGSGHSGSGGTRDGNATTHGGSSGCQASPSRDGSPWSTLSLVAVLVILRRSGRRRFG